MDPNQPVELSKPNPLHVMQPDEQLVCEIKRHPFGLIGMYFSVAVGLSALAVAVILAPRFAPDLTSQMQSLMMVGFLVIAGFSLLFVYISTYIYKNNRWVVTSDSITQISQISLFRKQSSQLSLANLEDVTAEQNGLIQSMFNFGALRVETAGERSKFLFTFCPNPNFYARQILAAREGFIRNDPSVAHRANGILDTPRSTQPTDQTPPPNYPTT